MNISSQLAAQRPEDKPQFAQRIAAMRTELRQHLFRQYKLENHDIFFVPSVRVGLVILSHLFHKQEVARCVSRQPVSELLNHPAVQIGEPGNVPLLQHVDPGTGEVRSLRHSQGKGVVDASDSFATLLHEELVRDSEIFVAPLNHHAALAGGLAVIVLRTADFSTLMRSELRLFEASTALPKPLEESLAIIRNGHWQPYNMARVGAIQLMDMDGRDFISASQPGLHFCCFPQLKLSEAEQQRIKSSDVRYFPATQTLRINCRERGDGKSAIDTTARVTARLAQLWSGRFP
ncbi:DUF6024 family protein [Erwinia sp. V71]|uniref:DUF6024 family protein n=1 Tax=Erwinia sp. V71 TaxID=3369424 RepID=UPI003F6429F8